MPLSYHVHILQVSSQLRGDICTGLPGKPFKLFLTSKKSYSQCLWKAFLSLFWGPLKLLYDAPLRAYICKKISWESPSTWTSFLSSCLENLSLSVHLNGVLLIIYRQHCLNWLTRSCNSFGISRVASLKPGDARLLQLSHWGPVMYVCIENLGHHWFR